MRTKEQVYSSLRYWSMVLRMSKEESGREAQKRRDQALLEIDHLLDYLNERVSNVSNG